MLSHIFNFYATRNESSLFDPASHEDWLTVGRCDDGAMVKLFGLSQLALICICRR
jgi:hypothetical protein